MTNREKIAKLLDENIRDWSLWDDECASEDEAGYFEDKEWQEAISDVFQAMERLSFLVDVE